MIELISESGHTEYYYTVSETAKLIALSDSKGKLIGRNKFLSILRYNGLVGMDNTPSQFILNMGLCKLHSTIKNGKHTFTLIIFSDKGVNYLKNNFKSGRYVIDYKNKKI